MKKYKQLTNKKRDLLAVLRANGKNIPECARKLKVSKSTISRELKRNTLPSRKRKPKYLPNTAQKLYENRRKDCKPKVKLYTKVELRKKIIVKLQKGWSPATIVGRMQEIEKVETVCHETIYKFIYESEIGKLNKLFEYLPYGKKRRTKWHGRRSKTDRLEGRKFIDQRPKEVEERKVLGHFETDSIVCRNHKPTNVIVERKSRKVFINKIKSFKAIDTQKAITKSLKEIKVGSITGDNGFEFSNHKKIEKKLKTNFYFCFPYHSWEKGTVENRNRVIRRYLPSKTDVTKMRQKDFQEIADDINDTPMKVLGFFTPNEVYSRDSCT